MSSQTDPRADDIALAIKLVSIDPGLGGIWLRAKASPVLNDVVRLAKEASVHKWHKINHLADDDMLFGGLDVGATLSAGKPIYSKGLLNQPNLHMILMQSECIEAGLAAKLSKALDDSAMALAIDEGDEDGLNSNLQDRLGFHFDLTGMRYNALSVHDIDAGAITEAKARIPDIDSTDLIETLTQIALQFGVLSLRAVLFVLKAAKAHAALRASQQIDDQDIAIAARLVLGPRATELPQVEEPADKDDTPEQSSQRGEVLEDQVLDAVKANLPSAALLAFLTQQRAARNIQGAGAGSKRKGNRRGRPLSPLPGQLSGSNRLDIMATLRRAVPWQSIRHRTGAIALRKEDFAIKRFETKSDRLIVFSVDASGSAAAQRLGEAKGAVETLLAEAYSRRDHVALIAFRKDGAEVLLPPTRSLVQAKKRLGALPGGGGTPLASGLQAGFIMALGARKKGMSPSMVLLSDGGANIALDGSPGRAQAREDAKDIARHFASQNMPCLTIDTGRRPDKTLQEISGALGGAYYPLPNAQSGSLGQTLKSALLD